MSESSSVILIPWDPESPEHVQTLYNQRREAGWNEDKINIWQSQHREGEIEMYWATTANTSVVSTSAPGHHTIYDTASQLGGKHRFPPSSQKFLPVGHVELRPEKTEIVPGLSDEEVVYSIHSLFVSSSVQSQGLGGAIIKAAEEMARQPPHNATEVILHTVHREGSLSKGRYAAKGIDFPKVILQDWYERKGYRVYKRIPGVFNAVDSTGKLWEADEVCMRKRLV